MFQPAFCRRAGRIALLALLCTSTAALTARGADTFDPMSQVGPNPVLPSPQQYLAHALARVVGWKQGETPTVAPGLTRTAKRVAGRLAWRSTKPAPY